MSRAGELAGRWTGVGSMPGVDPIEASRIVVGETPLLPALPELPARGAGSDMVGRTAAMLDGIAVAVVPSGWRVTDRPGADVRRARSWLTHDLDAFEEVCSERTGSVKVQLVGPWTLAAGIELASGESMLRDHGARRDLVTALAEAAGAHVRDVVRRLPDGTTVFVQIDEPLLETVQRGRVPTASGWGTYRGLDVAEVVAGLSSVVDSVHAAGAGALVHTCSSEPPLELILRCGVDAISFDLSRVGAAELDVLAGAVEDGVVLLPGVVDPLVDAAGADPSVSAVMDTVGRVQRFWSTLGFASRPPMGSLTLSPTCGLAGADPVRARQVLERLRQVAQALEEDPDGDTVR